MAPKAIKVYSLSGYEGIVAPADASPRWSVTFQAGVAEVPLRLFNSGAFQAYFERQTAKGRWTLEAPVQAAVEIIPAPKPKPKAKPKPRTPK